MLGLAKSISSGGSLNDYAMGKDNCEVLEYNNCSAERGNELKQEFALSQDQNTRCKNKDLSIVISPTYEDGQILRSKDFKEIGNDYMKKMKMQDHQYKIMLHDKKNGQPRHIHIVANRIDVNGKAYNDSKIGEKSQRVCDEIAQERGL